MLPPSDTIENMLKLAYIIKSQFKFIASEQDF